MNTKTSVLLYSLIIAVFSGTTTRAQTEIDSTYNNGYYQVRMEFFGKIPVSKNQIVFLGNSITEAGDWSDVLPGRRVANRGISGDNTFGIIARLESILIHKPARIFLMIGVNDLKRSVPNEVIIKNYRRIVAQITAGAPRTKLYLQSVLPVNNSVLIEPFKKVNNVNIIALNEALRQIAVDYDANYVDLWEVLANEGELKKELTPDGIHLKPVAYVHWAQYLIDKKYL